MLENITLVPNPDGTYDVLVEYSKDNVEFAMDFGAVNMIKTSSQRILEFINNNTKKAKISGVRIMVSGVLIATMAFSLFMASFAGAGRYSMGYLYGGTDQQQIEYVNRTNGALDTVSPSYFDIQQDGSLKLNYLSKNLINTMHAKGIKVVPFLSNHWNRTAGINALNNIESLSTQIANYIEQYNLDGVNVDIENVTHVQRNQYTEFVRLLRQKIPKGKEVSVAVAANPNNWQTGWHGSYDYSALAKYADHLVIMAYDEHYEGGSAGPVASIKFVENSIKYALTKTTADKIVVSVPLYGRVWSLDNSRIVGKGIKIETVNQIIKNCASTVTYDKNQQAVKAEFEIKANDPKYTVGGDFVLTPGKYVVWYENDESYKAKLNLISKYNLKGAGTWSLGQEDPSIWRNYGSWLNGGSGSAGSTTKPNTSKPSASKPSSSKPSASKPSTSTSSQNTSSNTVSSENEDSQVSSSLEDINQDAVIKHDQTNVDIYEDQDLEDHIIDTLTGGSDIFALNDVGNGIYKVRLPNNQIGYVFSKYIAIRDPISGELIPGEYYPRKDYIIYEVKQGDTLQKIAKKYLGSEALYSKIKELNELSSDVIYPGMYLKVLTISSNEDIEDSRSTQSY